MYPILVYEPLLILAAPDHAVARLPRVAPGDLAGVPMLLTEAGCGYRAMFDRTLAEARVQTATRMEFGSIEAIKQCVMAGMGITILPAVTVAAEVAQGRLAALPWTGPEYTIATQLAWHKDKWLSPALRAFLDLTREILAVRDVAGDTVGLYQPETVAAIETVAAFETVAAL